MCRSRTAPDSPDVRPRRNVRDARSASTQIHMRREGSHRADVRSKMRRADARPGRDVRRREVRSPAAANMRRTAATADMRGTAARRMRRSATLVRCSESCAARQTRGENNGANSSREFPCAHDTNPVIDI